MVTCIDDVLKLYNDYGVSVYNCVDLSLLARTVDNARWQGKYNNPLGLARLIESYDYRILVKGRITRSNWEAILNERQQECQHQLLFILVNLTHRFISQMLATMHMQDSHFIGNLNCYFCLCYQLLRSASGMHLMPLTVSSVDKMVHNGMLKTRITTLGRLHHRNFPEKLKPR